MRKLTCLCGALLGLSLGGFFSHAPLHAQTPTFPTFDIGTELIPALQIGLENGTNQEGRQTFVSGNSVPFGSVMFTHPELVTNGAAYLKDGNLILEAVVNVRVVYGGATSVALDLTRQQASTNSFRQTYYSLSVNRGETPVAIYTDPQKNRVATLTAGNSLQPIRLLMEITPQQTGRISDRFKLEAQAQ